MEGEGERTRVQNPGRGTVVKSGGGWGPAGSPKLGFMDVERGAMRRGCRGQGGTEMGNLATRLQERQRRI